MQIGGAYSSYKLRLLINDFTAGFYAKSVLIDRVFTSSSLLKCHLFFMSRKYLAER